MTDCIIEAGILLTGADAEGRMQFRHDCGLRVENGKIAQIGPLAALGHPELPRFGGPGMIAMPGLVNSHHHFGLTPLMAAVPFAPLEYWLPRFNVMRSLGPRLDTLLSAIEMLESGTTSVHHIQSALIGPDPDGWHRTCNSVLEAYDVIGMRVAWSFMIRDRNIMGYGGDEALMAEMDPPLRAWVEDRCAARDVPMARYMAFYRDARARHQGSRVRINLSPANLHWCSDAALEEIFGTAQDSGANVHMHLLETERQAEFARQRYGRSAVAHLHDLGVLGDNVTLGHGNWMTEEDLGILSGCGCQICHNASSGLRLGSGIAPVNAMRRAGLRVALGIDQSNIADDRDMTLEMKLVWALHRGTGLEPAGPTAAEVIRMATEHGAHSLGYGDVGRLEPGQQADVVLLDRARVEAPAVHPDTPVEDTVLHRTRREAVEDVFVAGRHVVKQGKVIGIDRDAIHEEVARVMAQPDSAEEMETRSMVARLMPYLERQMATQEFAASGGVNPLWPVPHG